MLVRAALVMVCLLPAVLFGAGDAEEAARLRREIFELIGSAPCNNLVNCRILALGARACGGPEEYVAYSTWARRDDIQSKAAEYNFLREELLAGAAPASGCQPLAEPKAACINSRCVLER
jgi:hypothetical protein